MSELTLAVHVTGAVIKSTKTKYYCTFLLLQSSLLRSSDAVPQRLIADTITSTLCYYSAMSRESSLVVVRPSRGINAHMHFLSSSYWAHIVPTLLNRPFRFPNPLFCLDHRACSIRADRCLSRSSLISPQHHIHTVFVVGASHRHRRNSALGAELWMSLMVESSLSKHLMHCQRSRTRLRSEQ